MPPGDLQLLLLGVARQLQHLHAVAQRWRDGVERVGGGDEHHLGEIEGQIEVVVAEGVVLLRVQHLQQRGGGVAAPVGGDLIYLVEHEDRVVRADALDRLQDAARHRADVGAAVAANLGLVVDAAERHADELAAQRAGDGLAERGLADARRADEAQDRLAVDVGLRRLAFRFLLPLLFVSLLLEAADGQVLEDAVLDLFEVVVILVEYLPRERHVNRLAGALVPGQRDQQLKIRADHRVFGRGGGNALQACQLAQRLLRRLLRHVRLFDLLAQLADRGGFFALLA